MLFPKNASNVSAIRMKGSDPCMSTAIIRACSVKPRKWAAVKPTLMPMTGADGRADERDGERHLQPGDEAGDHVASEPVGAERVAGIGAGQEEGRLQPRQQVLLGRRVMREDIADDGNKDETGEDEQGDADEPGDALHGPYLEARMRRIENAIEQIDGEVGGDHHKAGKEHERLDDGEIARGGGRNEQPADAGPGENGLDDNGAGQQLRQIEADKGDDRDRGVRHRMAQNAIESAHGWSRYGMLTSGWSHAFLLNL